MSPLAPTMQPLPAPATGITTGEIEAKLLEYFKLAGRAPAQVAAFGTAAGAEGRLESTTNTTKGKILIGSSAYDELKNFLGVGTKTPTAILQVTGAAAAVKQTAPLVLRCEGPAGGVALEEELGGEGSSAQIVCGKGGESTVVGFGTGGGTGGGGTFSAGEGGVCKGVNAEGNNGGSGGAFVFRAGNAAAALNSTKANTGGKGGQLSFTSGNGGNAEGTTGTRTGGQGGNIVFIAGAGGTGATVGGEGGHVVLEAGAAGGSTVKGGPFIIKAGLGSGTGAGGPFELTTYKEGSTVGGEIQVLANGEYIFKTGVSTRFQITPTGNIGFYGAAPVAQHPEIKVMAGGGAATVKQLEEKINELVQTIAANAGGVGLAK